jgi:hypothetical protein
MKTPITDAVWDQTPGPREYHAKLEETARRLELDRAALMEACQQWISERDNPSPCWVMKKQAEDKMRSSLSAARANFPTE